MFVNNLGSVKRIEPKKMSFFVWKPKIHMQSTVQENYGSKWQLVSRDVRRGNKVPLLFDFLPAMQNNPRGNSTCEKLGRIARERKPRMEFRQARFPIIRGSSPNSRLLIGRRIVPIDPRCTTARGRKKTTRGRMAVRRFPWRNVRLRRRVTVRAWPRSPHTHGGVNGHSIVPSLHRECIWRNDTK